MVLHHICANRACVNVEHLVLGTQAEHMRQHRQCDHDDRFASGGCRVCQRERERWRAKTDPSFLKRKREEQRRHRERVR
jgi:hypothetical protein